MHGRKAAPVSDLKIIDTEPRVVVFSDLDITNRDLVKNIQMSGNSSEILKTAEKTLQKARGLWQAKAVFMWVELMHTNDNETSKFLKSQNISCEIDFGYSARFLKNADYALVSVYTAGRELERQSMAASQKGEHLEAYFIDIIGLAVLDKVCTTIKDIAKKKAIKYGLGVSPFLSPGSVHGWKLEEQAKLCSFLPLDAIDVSIRDNAVLSPFKTVSCLIGMGQNYTGVQVGSTCQVCSKNHECQMKQNNQ